MKNNRKTIIVSKMNDDHTGYIMNFGVDEIDLFKKLSDNGVELKEDNLSEDELKVLYNYCVTDCMIEKVCNISNHYNRDQKTINMYKSNIEDELKAKGYSIITHSDWKPKFDGEKALEIINTRNYLTILCENIKTKEDEFTNLEDEVNELYEEQKENKNILSRQNYIKDKLNKDNEILHKDNEILQKQYDDLQIKFDLLVERYKKGEQYCESQLEQAKTKWPKDLLDIEIELKEKTKQIEELTSSINKLKFEKNNLDITVNDLKYEFEQTKKEKNAFNTKCRAELENIKNNKISILNDILNKIRIPKETSLDEIKTKFKTTVEMYYLNGRELPDFEIKYIKSLGLDDNDIETIKNIFFEKYK